MAKLNPDFSNHDPPLNWMKSQRGPIIKMEVKFEGWMDFVLRVTELFIRLGINHTIKTS